MEFLWIPIRNSEVSEISWCCDIVKEKQAHPKKGWQKSQSASDEELLVSEEQWSAQQATEESSILPAGAGATVISSSNKDNISAKNFTIKFKQNTRKGQVG